jgi:hypothetical protein
MTDTNEPKQVDRNRPTMAPGGCECSKCGCVFIGGETHTECGICANEPKRGTDAQILFERNLTCEAIDGAMAFGHQGVNPPPSDDHWLMPYWQHGARMRELEQAKQAPAVIEAIASEWDGCVFSGIGEDIDIGVTIRSAGKKHSNAAEPKQAPAVEAGARDDARRMRTLCRLLDAMDDLGNGFPGEVHAAFQEGAKVVRATLDRFAIPEDDDARAALARASEAAGDPAPAGWKLVPVEPTPLMSAAGFSVSEAEHDPAQVYRAMIEAAPQPASEQPYSAPFTTDVPQCCGSPESCNDPCEQPASEQQGNDFIGILTVKRFRGADSMVNTDFEYLGDLPDGSYRCYLHPTEQRSAGRKG